MVGYRARAPKWHVLQLSTENQTRGLEGCAGTDPDPRPDAWGISHAPTQWCSASLDRLSTRTKYNGGGEGSLQSGEGVETVPVSLMVAQGRKASQTLTWDLYLVSLPRL